jgi:hypothetical protein
MATKDEGFRCNKKDHRPWLSKNVHISFFMIKTLFKNMPHQTQKNLEIKNS